MNTEKSNKGFKITLILTIIVLIIVVSLDVLSNYVDVKDIFKGTTVTNLTKKEVTITDEGIAEAVDKLYDATVIVKVGKNGQFTGWGSGFVYKTDDKLAYILTNHHVVTGADVISIVYTDQSMTEGKVLGSDEFNDVAVVTVPVSTIKSVAEVGKSQDLRVGDTVFAIGTPINLEYSFSVTRGILSGRNRMVEVKSSSSSQQTIFGTQQAQDSWYMKLLQIDASINSGNSGGPLANCNGEVVGITSSKLSNLYSSTSIENIGFAIPIEDALDVATAVESGKKIEREKVVFGVSMTTLDAAKAAGIPIDSKLTTGAVIAEVVSDSIADKAGLKAGDVITKFDDENVDNYKVLKYLLYKHSSGDKIKLTYNRNGNEKEIEVTLKN